jgi:hypothetical protein
MSEDEVGRLVHEAWKRWRIGGGYPDHAFRFWVKDAVSLEPLCVCERTQSSHHDDMIDWADLRPEKREKYIVQGMAGYEARQTEIWWLEAIREDQVTMIENAEARVTALEARLAALTGALEQITSLPVSVGSLSDPNDSHKWWHIARSALAADPARGVMISAEEAELFIEMLEPSDTSPSADPELRESLRARLRPPGPGPEAAQDAPERPETADSAT